MAVRVITIDREFGSGGREVGEKVAEALGVAFYDSALMKMVAQQSGYSIDFVEENSEFTTSSLLYNLSVGGMHTAAAFSPDTLPPSDKVQILQNNLIRELAEKEPCVILGRAADYILRDRDDVLKIFIHADQESKLKRTLEVYKVPEKDAKKYMQRKDKQRAAMHRRYTDTVWGAAANYDLTLNTGTLGIEKCAELVTELAKHL